MVKQRMYYEIKKLQKQGYGKNRIMRELGIDKKSVRKYWSMDEEEYRHYQEKMRYREKDYDVYDYLEEKRGEMPANENSLRNYIRYLVETGDLNLVERLRYYTKVPDMPYGRQLQVDFGVRTNPQGGKYYIFAAVLSASRFKYASLQERAFTTMDLIRHLLDCFDYLHGMPEELVIDQDAVMVVDENAGDIIYTKSFEDFIGEMGLRMRVCRKADPESKGKIENFIKYIKHNFFAIREFSNLKEARASLGQWLERRANGKISQATKKIPAIEIEEERRHLKPLKNSIYRKDRASAREERNVNDKCRISVDSSLYDVPARYRNRVVEIYKAEDRLFVFDRHSGKEIAEYSLSLVPGQIVKNKAATRDMGVKVRDLRHEVIGYFVLENWKVFLEANFKMFSRYVRDQCLEARKCFYNKEVDTGVLDEALRFCIDNKTLSIANLHDCYRHFIDEKNKTDPSTPAIMVRKGVIRVIPELDVSKPDIVPYQSLLGTAGGHR
jgi:transposase